MSVRHALRDLVESKQGVVVPGAFDGVSARLVERAGFPAVYMPVSPRWRITRATWRRPSRFR